MRAQLPIRAVAPNVRRVAAQSNRDAVQAGIETGMGDVHIGSNTESQEASWTSESQGFASLSARLAEAEALSRTENPACEPARAPAAPFGPPLLDRPQQHAPASEAQQRKH